MNGTQKVTEPYTALPFTAQLPGAGGPNLIANAWPIELCYFAPKFDEVKSLSLNHRFVIALHSPGGVNETGLPECPSEKKGRKACPRHATEHFLRSGLSARVTELRGFPTILRGVQPGFSATQTEWRREQSDANPSPREFPANREKYREFLHFWTEKTAR
jgi:hypothetical protein